nr:HAD family hydrolase [Bacilli bacterium]
MPYRLILFDLDDTLSYFEDYWEAACKDAFASFPLTAGLDHDRLFHEYEKWNAILDKQYIAREIDVYTYRNQRFLRALGELGLTATWDEAEAFHALYFSLCERHMVVRPDNIALLTKLSQTYRLGIVTNGTVDVQMRKIRACGIQPFFPDFAIFISDQVGVAKPDARIYQVALNAFAVDAKDTIFIGDSWQNDVQGPRAIGITPIWLRRDPHVPIPDASVRTIDILTDIVHVLQE